MTYDEWWFQSTFGKMNDEELAKVNEMLGKLSGGEIKVTRVKKSDDPEAAAEVEAEIEQNLKDRQKAGEAKA